MEINLRIKLNFVLGIFLTFFTSIGQAQDTTSFVVRDETQSIGTYTLEECIKFALNNSISLKKGRYQTQISEKEVQERLATGYPQVDLRANFTDNIVVQKAIIPANNPPINPTDRPLALQFGAKFTSNFAVSLEQLIFDFAYLIGVKGARTYVQLAQQQIKQTEVDIISGVTKAYYAALINQERIALLDANYQRLDTLYKNTAAMFKNGMAERVDVMRTEVSLNNVKTEKDKLLKLQELTYQLLKYQMGMPVRDSLTLVGNIRELNLDYNSGLNEDLNYQNRIEYSLLQTNRRLQEINLQYNKSLYLPRLSASASYGANTGSNQFGEIWKFSQNWFSFAFVGINFSMPIIDGFRRKHTLEKVRLEGLKVDEDIKSFKLAAELQTETAKNSIVTFTKDLEIQKKNMELAQEVSRIAKVKYENGVGSTLEIVNAESSFKEAENNYYNALYNVVLSKVELDKALGKLGR
ncbi:MAG: TolC family protein [Microscillaceae bacterium]|jgi:outer membrane protein TolC|nr:TolC family protein [Microscillaceae bacterium]